MADNGQDCAQPGYGTKKSGICRSCKFARIVPMDHNPSPHYSQYSWPRDCLHHTDNSERYAARSLFELFRPRHSTTGKLMGLAD